MFSDSEAYGIGLVVRNSDGEVTYAQTWRFWGTRAPEYIEAVAIKEALSWSKARTE